MSTAPTAPPSNPPNQGTSGRKGELLSDKEVRLRAIEAAARCFSGQAQPGTAKRDVAAVVHGAKEFEAYIRGTAPVDPSSFMHPISS